MSTCGVYCGFRLPRSVSAIWVASRPSVLPSASTRYHSRVISPGLALYVFIGCASSKKGADTCPPAADCSERPAQSRLELGRAAVRGMADVGRIERLRGQPADGDDDATAAHLVEERRRRLDLGARRPPVRALAARMRRHDVPEQYLVLHAEASEHAVDDRRRRLGRTGAREQALGRERDP